MEMKQLKEDTPKNWVMNLLDLRDDKQAAVKEQEHLRKEIEQLNETEHIARKS